jgi:hypothetical protein
MPIRRRKSIIILLRVAMSEFRKFYINFMTAAPSKTSKTSDTDGSVKRGGSETQKTAAGFRKRSSRTAR